MSEGHRGELEKTSGEKKRREKKSKGSSSSRSELSSSSPDQVPDTGATTSLRVACE